LRENNQQFNNSMPIPKKSLGQNFLLDQKALDLICSVAEISAKDNVFEIGPGTGNLSVLLALKSKKLLMIEKDEQLANRLKSHLKNSVMVVGDVLEVNLVEILKANDFSKYKLVANIPYYITGRILRLFLENDVLRPELMVLLVQKEVAERICKKDGRASIMSISIDYYGRPELAGIISRESFFPVPAVDSAILKIKMKKPTELLHLTLKERSDFFRLVRIGFASRRKTLLNNFLSGFPKQDKNFWLEVFKQAEIDSSLRAERLALADWERIRLVLVKNGFLS